MSFLQLAVQFTCPCLGAWNTVRVSCRYRNLRFTAVQPLFGCWKAVCASCNYRKWRFTAGQPLFGCWKAVCASCNYRNWRFTAVQPLLGLWKAVCASCCYRNWQFDARPVNLPQCGPYMNTCEPKKDQFAIFLFKNRADGFTWQNHTRAMWNQDCIQGLAKTLWLGLVNFNTAVILDPKKLF